MRRPLDAVAAVAPVRDALRHGATLGCSVRNTIDLVGGRGLLEVFDPPAAPRPDVCTKSALTVAPYITARSMDLEWARACYDSYVRRRPRVEGANGTARAGWPGAQVTAPRPGRDRAASGAGRGRILSRVR